MNNRELSLTSAVVTAAIVITGCRTNKDILMDYERDLTSGNYAKATVEVSEKAKDEGVDQLLWQLHAAGAQYLAGNGEKAIGHFDGAEDLFIKNDGQSVFSQGVDGAFAMLSNDRVFPYAGGGQDRIFTCLRKAIDYANSKNVDAARTELNRTSQHQENWVYERRKDIVAARERLEKESKDYEKENKASSTNNTAAAVDRAMSDADFSKQIFDKTGFNPATDGNLDNIAQKDYMNVYAQHVCGVFRWLTDGSGRDYFKGLPELAPNAPMLATDLKESEGSAKPSNQVWIYVEDGLGPCREEWRLDLPLVLIPGLNRYVLYAGMALPYLRYRDAACNGYVASVGGNDRPLEVVQDMDHLLKVEHDVYMRGALTREITRVLVKAGVQIALGVTAENCNDTYTRYALKGAQLAAAAWAASVTQADLRNWTALPKKVYATRVTRPADGKIVLKGNGANVVELQVPEGNSMVFVSKPSALAAPVVRTVTF